MRRRQRPVEQPRPVLHAPPPPVYREPPTDAEEREESREDQDRGATVVDFYL
jgi:hypothetical protein